MKNLNLLNILIVVVASFILSGCSVSNGNAINIPVEKNAEDKKACEKMSNSENMICNLPYAVERISASSNFSAYGFVHNVYNNSTYAVLQATANAVLWRDVNYFTIVSPLAVSNTRGVLMNTPEEFLDKCLIGVDNIFYHKDPCKIHNISTRGQVGYVAIKVFSQPQENVLTYNAKEVISYLKKTNKYDKPATEHYYHFSLRKIRGEVLEDFSR